MAKRTKRKTIGASKKPATKPKPPSRLKWTDAKVEAFLKALVEFRGVTGRALKKVGMSHTRFYEKMKEDPAFAGMVTTARDQGVDMLEGDMIERAYRGVARYELHKGDIVYLRDHEGELIGNDGNKLDLTKGDKPVPVRRIEYSDAVGIRVLEAYRLRYRTRRQELTGADGADIRTEVVFTIPDNGRIPKGARIGNKRKPKSG